jgi:acetyl-CoA acetyltransferase
MAWVSGVGLTPFGRFPGRQALGWQSTAAYRALDDAGVAATAVDTMLVGYATTLHHLMPANVLAEHLGARPRVALGISVGGATGLAMIAHAARLVDAGAARTVLVAAGENRASGQSRGASTAILAQVGHADYEVPLGGNVPAYYALLASAYLHRHGLEPEALAPLAVQMRRHAAGTDGAQFRVPISAADVRGARMIADPLTLLDCCPVSDGGAAVVVSDRGGPGSVRIAGLGSANRHQHLLEADLDDLGARRSAREAMTEAGLDLPDVDVLGIYDSFTITLAMLLEEIGFAPPGAAGSMAAAGRFDRDGPLPLNTHGGLLSYGHCGVAGGMAHVVEVVRTLRSSPTSRAGLVHADGGVLSAHVTAVLTREPA